MALHPLHTEFKGTKGAMFRLALKTGVLTVLTLGLYRFWMKTRLRRFYWSAIRPGGAPLEYMGTGAEKLLGFLVAVVVMAFYIGVVNLVLMFFSFSLMNGNVTGYALSFAGVLPILFYAQYRARRYVLARTRWRGIRFGLDPGAWGYAWRAALHWALTILSLGILWPRMTFWLEKYRTDRTWFGTERFEQGGRWTELFEPMKHLYYPLGLTAVATAMWLIFENELWALAYLVTPFWALFGLAYWRAGSFRVLTANKRLGGARLRSAVRPGRVFGIYAGGYALIYLSIVGLSLAFLLMLALAAGVLGSGAELDRVLNGDVSGVPGWASTALFVFGYFAVFIFYAVLIHVFLTLPLMRHFAETLTIENPEVLARIGQRDRDEFAEAEGFAEALDIGAAI